MLRCLSIFLVCSLAMLTAGCTVRSESGTSDLTVRADPIPLQQLLDRMNARDFSVLFQGTVAGDGGELLWRRSGSLDRFDTFVGDGERNAHLGHSARVESGKDTAGCWWDFDDGHGTRVHLYCGSDTAGFDDLFKQSLRGLPMLYVGSRNVIGIRAACYRSDTRATGGTHDFAAVCISDDGMPLSFDVTFNLAGPVSLRATDASPRVDGDIATLPWTPKFPETFPKFVCSDELVLPPLPGLKEYLRDLPPNQKQCVLPTPTATPPG